jgi:iron(III) transport system substrate-binding protein
MFRLGFERVGWNVIAFAAVIFLPVNVIAASAPMSLPQLALFDGADRERILIEGAKKEGQLVFYNSHTWFKSVAQEFERKYPFVKVSEWRAEGPDVLKRIIEESRAGRNLADVVESTEANIAGIHKQGLLQEHYSPEIRFFDKEVLVTGKRGVFYWADRELYISLGFNTGVISPADAPKNLKDLLDPKWKGKMGVLGTTVFARWLGAVLDLTGREYVEQLSRQDLSIHRVSGAALATLMASGEVPLSPTMFDSNVFVVKRSGAPVEWRPIEPTVANVGYSGLVTKAPHTHAALLFLDYLHSKAGQQFVVKGGLSSPRDDVESLVPQKFKKTYLETKYSFDEYEKKLQEWEELIQKLFLKKK